MNSQEVNIEKLEHLADEADFTAESVEKRTRHVKALLEDLEEDMSREADRHALQYCIDMVRQTYGDVEELNGRIKQVREDAE